MEELKENINPFTINGYLSRKWYFILGLIIGSINGVLMLLFCKGVFVQIFELSKNQTSYSVFDLLTSRSLLHNELISYLILAVIGIILSFINNKKRIADIQGNEKYAYLLSAGISILTVAQLFPKTQTILYSIVLLLTSICSFLLLLVPGKISIKETEDVIPKEDETIETKEVVSFWKRWFAYILDACFIIGGLTSIVAIGMPDSAIYYGKYTMFIGIIITILYFGIMNSALCKGKTLGKMLMGLKVVDKFGNYLSLPNSFIRAFILTFCQTLPYLFATIHLYYNLEFSEKSILLTAFILSILFNLIFLFNIKTRQTLHDLAIGSYVIDKNNNKQLTDSQTNTTPIVIASIITLLIALPIFAYLAKYSQDLRNPDSKQYQNNELSKKIEQDLDIRVTNLNTLKTTDTKSYIIYVLTPNINDKELADNIYKYIKTNYGGNAMIILHKTIILGNIVVTKQKPYNFYEK